MKSSERGAILILVAVTLAALMALGAFAVDYGILWMARAQAQNAADSGALAGAVALSLDDKTWPIPAGGIAEQSATTAVALNPVMNVGAVPQVSSVCPPFALYAAPNDTNCIRVDVYRNGQFASPQLPTYFANIFGVSSQGIRATATAKVDPANASGCERPWFIIDKYTDVNGNGRYDAGDIYNPPGYSVPADIGLPVDFYENTSPSGYGQIDIGNGANAIGDAIKYCHQGAPFKIGDVVRTKPGANVGQERGGVSEVLSWDPTAYYDSTTKTVQGGCSTTGTCSCPGGTCPYGGTMSPRIVQAAICQPTTIATGSTTPDCALGGPSNGTIEIYNILSFFLVGCDGNVNTCPNGGGSPVINAILIGSSGILLPGGGGPPGGTFVTVVTLIQ
jgi:Flp pilus assembly protein TadG